MLLWCMACLRLQVIDLILDQPDSAVAAGVPVVTPWMVLHRVLSL